MPLDPTARAVIDSMAAVFPPIDPTVDGREMRRRVEEAAGKAMAPAAEPEPVGEVRDTTVPGPADDLAVRIYRPARGERGLPTVVFFHGGGFVLCDLDSHDNICRAICNAAPAVIVAVNYRRAPEDRYPAAVDDCYAIADWAVEHAHELGGDPSRVVVAGDSAGGNLAAAVALMARDRSLPLAGQALVYPMLDRRGDAPSHSGLGEQLNLTHEEVMYYWDQYLGEASGEEPYASPSFAPDLSGVAPAYVATAEYDPLRDEGEAYADALAEAGVRVVRRRYAGMIHSFFTMLTVFPAAQQLRDEIGAFVRDLPPARS